MFQLFTAKHLRFSTTHEITSEESAGNRFARNFINLLAIITGLHLGSLDIGAKHVVCRGLS